MEIQPGYGPAPTPTPTPPALSVQRKALLEVLAAQTEPSTVEEIARLTGLHPNTVRNHLDGLVEHGLVSRRSVRSGRRGRPSWQYRAIPERMSGAPEYVGLAMSLAQQIAAHSANPGEVARAAGEHWATQIPAAGGTTADVVELLSDLGFAPRADGRDIRLEQCPLLSAARRNPEVVCGVHDGLIRARLTDGQDGRLEPFAGPGYCMWHGSGEPAPSADPDA